MARRSESRVRARRACVSGGWRRNQANSTPAIRTPGRAASQVRSSPNRPTDTVANIGPSAQPSVPPVTQNDMDLPRSVPVCPASEAVCG